MPDSITVDEYGRIIGISGNVSAHFQSIMNDWVSVSGTFDTFNFLSPLKVTDAGGGVLNIEFPDVLGVAIQKDGVALPSPKYNTLNFRGAQLTLVETAPGAVDIYLGGVSQTKAFRDATVTTTNTTVTAIPPGSILRSVIISVTSPYNTGATIEVVDTSTSTVLVPASASNPQSVGDYIYNVPFQSGGITSTLDVVISGATSGAATVRMDIDVP